MLTVKENRVPRVEYGLRRRERSSFFFGELASSWDTDYVRTRTILLVNTKIVLPDALATTYEQDRPFWAVFSYVSPLASSIIGLGMMSPI